MTSPTQEQIDVVADEIVRVARTHESVKTLADVDRLGTEEVGVCPFEPRVIAEAAMKKALEVCGGGS